MRRTATVAVLILSVAGVGCSAPSKTAVAPTVAVTAPPPQAVVISTPTPSAPLSANVPPADVVRIANAVKLQAKDLPAGFGLGQMEGFQNNQSAALGFDEAGALVQRMDATGRLGGIVQSLSVKGGGSAADTIDVWKDASGCKTYFDQYPKPASDTKFSEVSLPHPVGDQSLALRIEQSGQVGYSIAWRRGRIILGVGDLFPAGSESLDAAMLLVDALDRKAQAVSQ